MIGVLIEEQLKNQVIGFDEKYKFATDQLKEITDNDNNSNSNYEKEDDQDEKRKKEKICK